MCLVSMNEDKSILYARFISKYSMHVISLDNEINNMQSSKPQDNICYIFFKTWKIQTREKIDAY